MVLPSKLFTRAQRVFPAEPKEVSANTDQQQQIVNSKSSPANTHSQLSWFDSLLSKNPERRKGEKFFWYWHCFWLLWFGGIVVFKTYEDFNEWSYMKVGFVVGLPPILLPLFFPKLSGEENTPWFERFTTKANCFIFLASWIGNYFWTHYFYKVLGTGYTFPGLCLNEVPFALYLITHSYFLLYHCVASICIRAFWRKVSPYSKKIRWALCVGLYIFMGYVTAVVEVATIASFPYYTYPDSYRMWVIGSGFYGIYFLISYPYFTLIDDDVSHGARRWTLMEVFVESLAYGMITTMMLDAWRLLFGALNPPPESTTSIVQHAICLPWW